MDHQCSRPPTGSWDIHIGIDIDRKNEDEYCMFGTAVIKWFLTLFGKK